MKDLHLVLLVLAAVLAACSAAPPHPDAAGMDAADMDAADTEATHADAANDVGPTDGSRCVPETLATSCVYRDYGEPCPVPCDFPSTCTYSVAVTWTGDYCCISNTEHFFDCTCDHGTTLCRSPTGGSPRSVPFSTCEFCGLDDDGGVDAAVDDAAVEDASTDEPDAAVEG